MSRSFRLKLVLVAITTFAFAMVAINAQATYGAKISVDEPQYLLTAQSLIEDGDLDISDELEDKKYWAYHPLKLNQQTIDLNEEGQRISPHDPLLPLILAIPMGLGGWLAAKLTLALIAAVTAAATLWVAVRRFSVSESIATVVVGMSFAAPPMTVYATQVYPEMLAALCLVLGVGLVTSELKRPQLLWLSIPVTALPWLSVKYVPVAFALVFVTVVLLRKKNLKDLFIFGGILFASGLIYLFIHQRIYGGWTVYSSGDHFINGEFEVVGRNPNFSARSRRLSGLLFDRGFGLVPWAPFYFALIPSCVAAIKWRVKHWSVLGVVTVTGWVVATWVALTMHGWWWPGRQLVVILPAAIILLAILSEKHKVWRWYIFSGGVVAITGWIWLAVEAQTGRRTLIVDFEETGYPIYRFLFSIFPNFRDFGTKSALLNILWIALSVLSILPFLRKGKAQNSTVSPELDETLSLKES
mgnify:CR=1 FL=1